VRRADRRARRTRVTTKTSFPRATESQFLHWRAAPDQPASRPLPPCRRRPVEYLIQAIFAHRATDVFDHEAADADHHPRWHAAQSVRRVEPAVGVVARGVRHPCSAEEPQRVAAVVLAVDTEEGDAIAAPPVDSLECRHLLAARDAPRGPEVNHDGLPGDVGQRHVWLGLADVRQPKRRCRLPDGRRPKQACAAPAASRAGDERDADDRDGEHDKARPPLPEKPPGQATVTVPLMFGWTSQWKGYVPAGGAVKV